LLAELRENYSKQYRKFVGKVHMGYGRNLQYLRGNPDHVTLGQG